MQRFLGSGLIVGSALALSSPALACQGVQFQKTIYPIMEEKPTADSEVIGSIFKVRYNGERTGRPDRLWPNYYVVEVTEGERKGEKLAIPAHVTSCHSVYMGEGIEGYVMGALVLKDREGKPLDMPILETRFSGQVRGFPDAGSVPQD